MTRIVEWTQGSLRKKGPVKLESAGRQKIFLKDKKILTKVSEPSECFGEINFRPLTTFSSVPSKLTFMRLH